jgi:hypothetical protein
MKLNIKKIITSLFMFVLLLTLSGCFLAAVSVGDGTVNYIKGDYSMNVKSSQEDAYNATLKTLSDNNSYMLVSKQIDTNSAEVEAVTKTKGPNISINIYKETTDVSRVVIRFGKLGNQEKSTRLMDQIQANIFAASK